MVWVDVDLDTAWAALGGHRPSAGRRPAAVRASVRRARAAVRRVLADVVVPTERSHRMADVLAAARRPARRRAHAVGAPARPHDYPAYIGPGLLAEHAFWPAHGRGPPVSGHRRSGRRGCYGDSPALRPLDGRVAIMPGEQSKTIAHAEIVWSELARAGMTRADVVVALGGGVVGDLAGLLRRHLPARRALRPGADDAGGAGRLGLRRQDRRRSRAGQELRRRLPPAAGGDRRHRRAAHAAAEPSWPPATPRWSRRR